MAEQAQRGSRGLRAAVLLRRLVFAYAGLMAEDDPLKASIVLGEFARAYNEHRAQFIQTVAEGYRDRFPQRVSSTYDGETIAAMRALVAFARGESGETAAAAMPFEATRVAAWFTDVLRPTLGSNDLRFVEIAQETPVAQLDRVLNRYVETGISTGTAEYAPAGEGEPVPFDTPRPDHTGGPIQVPGRTQSWQMPTWGWWALGLGLVAGAGYLTYRIGDREGWWEGLV